MASPIKFAARLEKAKTGQAVEPTSTARKNPVNSESGNFTQENLTKEPRPTSEVKLPTSWTEIILDPKLWSELREMLLGFDSDG
jgi:hypothetical protein